MRRRRIVLDTDVASGLVADRLEPLMAVRIGGSQWVVTFATVGELQRWAEAGQWGERRRSALDRWLDSVTIIHSDDEIAREWGRSTGRALLRGRTRPDNDAWIAACCQVNGLPLATYNVKDFAYHVEHDELVLVG